MKNVKCLVLCFSIFLSLSSCLHCCPVGHDRIPTYLAVFGDPYSKRDEEARQEQERIDQAARDERARIEKEKQEQENK